MRNNHGRHGTHGMNGGGRAISRIEGDRRLANGARSVLVGSMIRIAKYLTGVAIAAFTGSAFAAEPDVAWTFQAGGKAHDKARAMAVDASGAVYITGEFTDTATFGEHDVVSRGKLDFFLAKLDRKGRLVWLRTEGGAEIDRGYAVAVDRSGNVCVTGHFQSPTITFGSNTLTNAGDYDVFIAKYGPDGQPLWARRAGGAAYDYGHGIAVNESGAVFVSGSIRGGGDYAGSKKTAEGSMGPFVARFSSKGELNWAREMIGRGSGSAHEIAVDRKGEIYVGGYFTGSGAFGQAVLSIPKGRAAFALKLDSQGRNIWSYHTDGATDGMVSGIAADGEGNCFLGGMFKGAARFGEQTFENHGDNDLFMAKLDKNGKPVWAHAAGGPGTDYGLGLAVDGNDDAVITGETTGDVELAGTTLKAIGKRDIYVAKFSTSGKLSWVKQTGGTLNGLSYAAACGPDGMTFFAGAFSGELNVEGETLISAGSNDIIVGALREAP